MGTATFASVSYTHLKHASKNGVYFAEPRIDLDEVRAGKEAVVAKLTGGLAAVSYTHLDVYKRQT